MIEGGSLSTIFQLYSGCHFYWWRILLDVIVSLKQKDTTNILFYWEEYEMKFEIL
jgi:hypothetical protein